MMTFEQYRDQKLEIEENMHSSKVEEKKEAKEMMLKYEDKIKDLEIEFRRQRNELRRERDERLLDISKKYKEIRRELWMKDAQLTIVWRQQVSERPEFAPSANEFTPNANSV